ncbi:hypothetical protein IC617_08035 [Neiella sp. HB171785]|uniref:Uncharacterized protein n=1 Tax=Neiella litorisoli TaxID=2771431 RepID=A0A8J6UPS8_9GAMM|nr:hypothetical protein [Neiella litorisoli]MBD1389372.1 hypothetical protein [Neiella litorisoli]
MKQHSLNIDSGTISIADGATIPLELDYSLNDDEIIARVQAASRQRKLIGPMDIVVASARVNECR